MSTGKRIRRALAAGAPVALLGLLGLAAPAAAVEGRYVGSIVRSEIGDETFDVMRHQLDLGVRETTPGGYDMRLRTALTYASRPGEEQTGLLRARLFGDLQAPSWRLHGQWVPWQGVAPGDAAPRERNVQLGLDLVPRNLPSLLLNYTRRDRDNANGLSRADDRRAEISYTLRGFGAFVTARRLDNRPLTTPDAASSSTEELRGGLQGRGSWSGLSGQGTYDVLRSDSASRERDVRQFTHRLNLNGIARISRRLSFGASALARRGYTRDNAQPERRDIDELSLDANAQYLPVRGLTLEVSGAYRRRQITSGDAITNVIRSELRLLRQLYPGTMLHGGVQQTIDLDSRLGEVPPSTAFLLFDSRLRRDLEARLELRGSKSTGTLLEGIQWRTLAQVTADPRPSTHLEATLSHSRQPQSGGVTQRDRRWELTMGYSPFRGGNLVGSLRAQDGSGRLDRAERFASLTSAWQTSNRSRLSLDWSRRHTQTTGTTARETTAGLTFKFILPGYYESQLHWRRVAGDNRDTTVTYGLTMTKSF